MNNAGSLTTYPCSEGVKWLVMKDSVEISATDLYYLRTALGKYTGTVMDENGNNARPVQPLNNRVVLQYSPSAKTRPGGSSSFTDPPGYFQKTTTSFPVLLAMATLAGIILSIALALLVVYFWRQHFHFGKFSSFHLSNEGIRSFITTKTTAASSSSRRSSMGDPTSTSTSSEQSLFHGRVAGFKTPYERLMCKIASASAQQATEEGFKLYHPQNSDYVCSSSVSGDRGIDVGSSKSYGGPGTVSPGHNRYFYPRFTSSTSTWG